MTSSASTGRPAPGGRGGDPPGFRADVQPGQHPRHARAPAPRRTMGAAVHNVLELRSISTAPRAARGALGGGHQRLPEDHAGLAYGLHHASPGRNEVARRCRSRRRCCIDPGGAVQGALRIQPGSWRNEGMMCETKACADGYAMETACQRCRPRRRGVRVSRGRKRGRTFRRPPKLLFIFMGCRDAA